jgi:hypothetical protein
MRPLAFLLTVSLGLVLGALAIFTLSWLDQLPPALRPATVCPPQPKPCTERAPNAATPSAAAPARPPERVTEPAPTPKAEQAIERYVVCESSQALPTLRLLRLDQNARPVATVHCGQSVHVVAFDAVAGTLGAQRIMRIDSHAPTTDLLVQPALVVASDVSADGHADLLVPFWWQDKTGAPRGGSVYELVRDPSGGFAAPLLLSSVAARAVTAGHFDEAPGADLALANLEDARVGRHSELVFMHGGPAPYKAQTVAVGNDVRDLAALDLDLDSRDDLVVAAQKPSVEVLYLAADATVRARAAVVTGETRQILTADVDGDGHDDAVLVGEPLAVLLASPTTEPTAHSIAVNEPVRSVFPVDLNADGKLDLLVTTASSVVLLTQTTALRFEPKTLLALPGNLLPVSAAAISSDADGHFALLVLALEAGKPPVELAMVALAPDLELTPNWSAEPTPLRDAPVGLHFVTR